MTAAEIWGLVSILGWIALCLTYATLRDWPHLREQLRLLKLATPPAVDLDAEHRAWLKGQRFR